MAEWWDHLLHTPMSDLAWTDQIVAVGLIFGLLVVVVGGWTLIGDSRRRRIHRAARCRGCDRGPHSDGVYLDCLTYRPAGRR